MPHNKKVLDTDIKHLLNKYRCYSDSDNNCDNYQIIKKNFDNIKKLARKLNNLQEKYDNLKKYVKKRNGLEKINNMQNDTDKIILNKKITELEHKIKNINNTTNIIVNDLKILKDNNCFNSNPIEILGNHYIKIENLISTEIRCLVHNNSKYSLIISHVINLDIHIKNKEGIIIINNFEIKPEYFIVGQIRIYNIDLGIFYDGAVTNQNYTQTEKSGNNLYYVLSNRPVLPMCLPFKGNIELTIKCFN